jgi:hypothetical protein
MIEVFKTNIETKGDAHIIIKMLAQLFPGSRINFDLHDCDKILRMEGNHFSADEVVALLSSEGFTCEVLE